jgi:two-component system sensor histidine kinase/response regulator
MIRSSWKKVIGQPPDFSLEARIFNVICVASAFTVFVTVFSDFLLGLPQLAVLMAVVFVVSVFCYYYSRVKMKLTACMVVYVITINILLIVNFKYNSGIDGPTLLIFTLAYFLTISIIPQKQYWLWITLNLVIVFTLLLLEYNYPGMVLNTYTTKGNRFIDFGLSYFFVVFLIFLVTTAVRKSYRTEQKLVEQKATELENLNDTKNKLFSILAHDLRSPLSSIQNYLEILSDLKLNEHERQSIQRELLNSTQNTQQMLANLLFWSKSQMDGVSVNMVNINLKQTLRGTFQIHKTIAAEKNIQLTDRLANSIFIKADKDMLQLIVRNLINNAIKFTEPGGEITVSATTIDGECCIAVKDNGMGIPYEQQSDIFSLKVNSTFGTKNEKGVGLGLVLCKEFSELQNGEIAFESTPGIGTTFYLSFKLSPAINENNVPEKRRLIKKS